MPRYLTLRLLAVGALLPLAFTWDLPVHGCRAVAGDGVSIRISDEEAIIVWDAAHHREDFIRRATFQTKAQNIGFLVPTPTAPTLAEADPTVFTHLEGLIHPLTKGRIGNTGFTHLAEPSLSRVQVLHTQQVAGYEAAVLAADDTVALTGWLKAHGYVSLPEDRAWLEPYVRAHWKITAFKIAKSDPANPIVTSSLVRMSFGTTQPFFPYREPADNAVIPGASSPRLLRVFLLADHPMQGGFKNAGLDRRWPGTVVGVNQLPDDQRGSLARQTALSPSQLPIQLYLTTFEDHSSPRPGISDVVFRAAQK